MVSRENRESQALVFRVQQDPVDVPGYLEQMEKMVKQAELAPKDLKDQLDPEELQVVQDNLEWMVKMVMMAAMVRMVSKVRKENVVMLVQGDLLEQPEKMGVMENVVNQVNLDQQEAVVRQAAQERPVIKVVQVMLERLGRREQKVAKENQAVLALWVLRVQKDPQDGRVKMVKLDVQA